MADLAISTDEQVRLHVAATDGLSETIPPDPPVAWTTSDDTVVGLASVEGNGNSILAVGVGVGSATVTASNGVLSDAFTFTVVDPAATGFTVSADDVESKDGKQLGRGRGLGLGYA